MSLVLLKVFIQSRLKRTASEAGFSLQYKDGDEDDECEETHARFAGDDAVDKIKAAIRKMGDGPRGIHPSVKQSEFQAGCIASLFPLLYGTDWDRNAELIKKRHDVTDVMSFSAFVAARSDGKTAAVSMVLAALLYAIPERQLVVGIFAMVQRQTSMLIDKAYEFISMLPGGSEMTEKSEKQLKVWPRGASHRTTLPSVVYAKSKEENAARGLQPHLIIVDEAWFVPDRYFYNVILPMVLVDKRVLWAITSPTSVDGVFCTLVNLRGPDGKPVCASVRTDACSYCPGGPGCPHRLVRPLAHKADPKKADIMRMLYGRNKAIYQRELAGMASREDTSLFDKADITTMFATQIELKNPAPFIAVGIDPSGGGDSKTAWVIAVFQDETFVVSHPLLFTVAPHRPK